MNRNYDKKYIYSLSRLIIYVILWEEKMKNCKIMAKWRKCKMFYTNKDTNGIILLRKIV